MQQTNPLLKTDRDESYIASNTYVHICIKKRKKKNASKILKVILKKCISPPPLPAPQKWTSHIKCKRKPLQNVKPKGLRI